MPCPPSDPTLCHEIGILLLDKLLLAGVVLGVAHYLNRKLENFKARRALEGEFLRERTKRLEELFSMMLDLEAESTRYVSHALKFAAHLTARHGFVTLDTYKPPPELGDSRNTYRELSVDLRRRASNIRPWIGDALTKLSVEYEHVVDATVIEQTADAGPDEAQIERLRLRTAELQAAIVNAIREGAPAPATIDS